MHTNTSSRRPNTNSVTCLALPEARGIRSELESALVRGQRFGVSPQALERDTPFLPRHPVVRVKGNRLIRGTQGLPGTIQVEQGPSLVCPKKDVVGLYVDCVIERRERLLVVLQVPKRASLRVPCIDETWMYFESMLACGQSICILPRAV